MSGRPPEAAAQRARRVREAELTEALDALGDLDPDQRRAVERLADRLTARVLARFAVGRADDARAAERLFQG